MKQQLISFLKFLLFLSIGLGILYYLYYTQNQKFIEDCIAEGGTAESCNFLNKLANDFRGVNYIWIGMVAVAFLLSNVSRALRWNMLLRPLGNQVTFKNTFLAVLFGYFVNSFLPRVGEVAKCGVINQYDGVKLEKVLGTAVVDRILDVLMLLVVVGLALVLQFDVLWGYLSENASLGDKGNLLTNPLVIIGLIVMVVGGVLLFIFRKKLMQSVVYKKIESIIMGFVDGLKTIGQLKNPGLFVAHTLFIWLMYFLMLRLAFYSFEPTAHLGAMTALVTFVFGAFGMVIPSPGGIGSYQFLVMTALSTFYGITEGDAFAFANIAFFAPYLCNIIFGFIAFLVLPLVNTKGGKKA